MRYLVAVALGAHGVAHLVGFAVAFHLFVTPELTYRTTLFGGLVDVGHVGTRIVGLLWFVVALACVVAAAAMWEGSSWSWPLALAALGMSLVLCATALPEARLGVLMNLVLLAVFLAPRWTSTPHLP